MINLFEFKSLKIKSLFHFWDYYSNLRSYGGEDAMSNEIGALQLEFLFKPNFERYEMFKYFIL